MPLSGEVYQVDNTIFWTVIHKVTIGGPAWDYVRQFKLSQEKRGDQKALRNHFERKPHISGTKEDSYKDIDIDVSSYFR